jgi:predicted permease
VHLARQLVVEALLLAMVGSGLGWLLASRAVAATKQWAPPSVPRLGEVSLDGTAVLVAAALTAVVMALLAAAPLAAIARGRAGDALRPASRGTIGDRWNYRVRHAMVAGQIAAALVLLLATLGLLQNLLRLQAVHPGFDPEGVFQARVSIPLTYRQPEDVSRFYDRLRERLAASPGVAGLGVISVAPLSGVLRTVPVSVAGQPIELRDRASANLRAISPGYLSTVGTRLLSGRSFSELDRFNTPHVALVSTALADRLLSGKAVGERLLINDNNQGPRPVDIVGVVENVRQAALDLPPALDLYIPLSQIHPDEVSSLRDNQFWMVGTRSDPASFRTTFLAHLRTVDPDAAVSDTGTMRHYLDAWLGPRRFSLGLFGAFALTAVFLAVVGLYGLVSYAVGQRRSEIGLRMAVGATQGEVQRMILSQAAGLGLAGAAFGLGVAVAARPLVSRMAQDLAVSPTVMVATAALLIGVVLMAAWLPARRAARIEPTLALRAQ